MLQSKCHECACVYEIIYKQFDQFIASEITRGNALLSCINHKWNKITLFFVHRPTALIRFVCDGISQNARRRKKDWITKCDESDYTHLPLASFLLLNFENRFLNRWKRLACVLLVDHYKRCVYQKHVADNVCKSLSFCALMTLFRIKRSLARSHCDCVYEFKIKSIISRRSHIETIVETWLDCDVNQKFCINCDFLMYCDAVPPFSCLSHSLVSISFYLAAWVVIIIFVRSFLFLPRYGRNHK